MDLTSHHDFFERVPTIDYACMSLDPKRSHRIRRELQVQSIEANGLRATRQETLAVAFTTGGNAILRFTTLHRRSVSND